MHLNQLYLNQRVLMSPAQRCVGTRRQQPELENAHEQEERKPRCWEAAGKARSKEERPLGCLVRNGLPKMKSPPARRLNPKPQPCSPHAPGLGDPTFPPASPQTRTRSQTSHPPSSARRCFPSLAKPSRTETAFLPTLLPSATPPARSPARSGAGCGVRSLLTSITLRDLLRSTSTGEREPPSAAGQSCRAQRASASPAPSIAAGGRRGLGGGLRGREERGRRRDRRRAGCGGSGMRWARRSGPAWGSGISASWKYPLLSPRPSADSPPTPRVRPQNFPSPLHFLFFGLFSLPFPRFAAKRRAGAAGMLGRELRFPRHPGPALCPCRDRGAGVHPPRQGTPPDTVHPRHPASASSPHRSPPSPGLRPFSHPAQAGRGVCGWAKGGCPLQAGTRDPRSPPAFSTGQAATAVIIGDPEPDAVCAAGSGGTRASGSP